MHKNEKKNTLWDNKKKIQNNLIKWYEREKRDLPWRKTTDPYCIWISEVMLQQTVVEAVKGYYSRFLNAFPNVNALARSEEDHLMKLWEGLGYYSRARNLKRAAQQIVEEYGGHMPEEEVEIRKLPGVGPYTAGAVLSIAFKKSVPAVDGNVIRVYSRLFGIEDFVDERLTRQKIDDIAKEWVSKENPGSYNQSLMELGATVCRPKNPKCLICPIYENCCARKKGIESELPKKKPRKAKKEQIAIMAVLEKNDTILIVKRPSEGLLANMWGLPTYIYEKKDSPQNEILNLQDYIENTFGLKTTVGQVVGSEVHVFTHIRWDIRVVLGSCKEEFLPEYPQCVWVKKNELLNYAFPTAYKKVFKLKGILNGK